MDIQSQEFKQYLADKITAGPKEASYKFYSAYADKLSIHTLGKNPEGMLKDARPGESEEVRRYRIKNYEPKTQAEFGRVMNVLYNIFNPKLFKIDWQERPAS